MSEFLLPGLSHGHATQLDDRLRAFLADRELPLYRMMAYQMGWVDEKGEPSIPGEGLEPRIVGQSALAAAAALGSAPENAVEYALTVELAHNAALIHEDVEDGNNDRHGRPSVWWTWGPAQAINAGDGMQAMARLSLFSLLEGSTPKERVSAALEVLDDAVLTRCEGEYLDITYQERMTLSPEQYFEMAESRAGGLLGGACALGAICALGPGANVVNALNAFGRKIGAARQVASDIESLWGERDLSDQGRLISKKKNLAIVYALENGNATLRRKLGELYMQRVLDPSVIGQVAELAETAGGREFCLESVLRLVGEAESRLATASISDTQRAQLMDCAAALTDEARG